MLKMSDMFNPSKDNKKKNDVWADFLRKNEYPETAVYSAALKLNNMSPDLQEILWHWDQTGDMPDVEAEGFTVQELMEYKGLNEIAAVLMLDWIRREPEDAKLALAEPITRFSIGEAEIRKLKQSNEIDTDGESGESVDEQLEQKEYKKDEVL